MGRRKGGQYKPGTLVGHKDVASLEQAIADELEALANQLGATPILQLEVQHSAPEKPRNGMVVYADGSDWDPGEGEGVYHYVNGAWVLSSITANSIDTADIADGAITGPKLAAGAVSSKVPIYSGGGNLQDAIGTISNSYQTLATEASVVLDAGNTLSAFITGAVYAKTKSDKKRKVFFRLVLDGQLVAQVVLVFKKPDFLTVSKSSQKLFTPSSNLSGNLVYQVKASATSKFVVHENDSDYQYFVILPE